MSGLSIYGLYAVSDIDVSEKDLVQYIVYYNDQCAGKINNMNDEIKLSLRTHALN